MPEVGPWDDEPLISAFQRFVLEVRHSQGCDATPVQLINLVRAVSSLAAPDLEFLYWSGRVALGVTPPRVAAYDEAFARVFLQGVPVVATLADEGGLSAAGSDSDGTTSASLALPVMGQLPREDGMEGQDDPVGGEASSVEVLRFTPFESCTPDEQEVVRALIRRLRLDVPRRQVRRFEPAVRHGHLDLRRTVLGALRTHDEFSLHWRSRRIEPRRILMMLDVSRSMSPYARMALHFAHAMCVSQARVEVVCFGTRVTRVTRLLRRGRSELALQQAAESVLDWDGGTRLGEAFKQVLRTPALRGSVRGSVVVVISDGLEQDDPRQLGHMLRRLRRSCHSIIWGNPLASDPEYQPLTGGMVAASPHIDLLCPAASLADFENLARSLSLACGAGPAAGAPESLRSHAG